MSQNNECYPLDISTIVNRGFKNDAFGQGGWLNLQEDDARGIVPGVCSVGKVPFRILDPKTNANKSVLVLHPDDPLFAAEKSLSLEKTFGRIYVLHTACISGITVGSLVLNYADGSLFEISVDNDVHLVGNWWESDLYYASEARPVCFKNTGNLSHECVKLYGASIKNPHPDRVVDNIVFRAGREKKFKPTWIVVALVVGPSVDRICARRLQTIRVNIGLPMCGCAIRRLHGVNMAPPLTSSGLDITADIKALNIPLTRLHDDALENSGMQLVDISRVFPIFSADHNDPANYYFEQTDDYIANCITTGTKIMYRLGESIEHSKRKYFVHPPVDYEKWSDICINIIRHYNEGWANGFHYGIEYWAIWEEPNTVPCLWTGSWEDYIRMYVIAAKKIKHRFPNLKVGGPTRGGLMKNTHLLPEFLKACRAEGAPLDFCAWTCYQRSLESMLKQPEFVRKLLDEHGFTKTEVHLSEWHYFPGVTPMLRNPLHWSWLKERMTGSEAAAFICAALSGWQDTPLDMANHYVGTALSIWGLFDRICRQKNKCYYAMDAFNRLTAFSERLSVQLSPKNLVKVLAGRKSNGDAAMLISCFMTNPLRLIINLDNCDQKYADCCVSLLDDEHDLEILEHIAVTDGKITLRKPAGSAVFLLEFFQLGSKLDRGASFVVTGK